MTNGIGRRQFLSAIGGATLALPLAARAQPKDVPVIGIIGSETAAEYARNNAAAFRQGLKETGFIEGRNLTIEYRGAENHVERLPSLAADLVRRKVAVIAATQSSAPAFAAKAATKTIPIVFANGGDPVKLGLVSSLNQPGGNLTGISFLLNALGAKRLELLHELVPAAKIIGILFNPTNPSSQACRKRN